jgi:hypothetical protein
VNLCAFFDPSINQTCRLENLTYSHPSNQTLYVTYNGSIEFMNVSLTCTDECVFDNETELQYRWDRPTECCRIIVNASGAQGNITIFGGTNPASSLRFGNIEMYAGDGLIKLDFFSKLDA